MSKESGKVSLQIRTSLKKELALVREVVLPVLDVGEDAQGRIVHPSAFVTVVANQTLERASGTQRRRLGGRRRGRIHGEIETGQVVPMRVGLRTLKTVSVTEAAQNATVLHALMRLR